MNLALHGFLLQVFVSILDFRHGRWLCSAGEPGYLDFDNLPETNFSCQGKVIGGYYADVEAGCQMFHVCTIGQKDEIMDIKFLCLNGTVFDQETRVCERVDEVDCSKSERFYNLNLELYGNNAVTLSLHEHGDDEDDLTIDPVEDHQTRTTSARPSTTSTTSTTTSRPSKPSTTAASGSFQHPAGYPQHYQPQPPFPQVHTSQSKSLYDDKNGGYHHQYIFHNGGERTSNQATSYQLFSSQGVSSTTVPPAPPPPPSPQIHQIRYSSTVGPPPQIIHSEPSTVTPLFHATSSTIQTLLNNNVNSPAALINPIFHNHGIASTTEHFAVHSNNPRETSDYRDDGDQEQDIGALEAIQSVNKGKISKLTISPMPSQQELSRTVQTKTSQTSQQQQQRISGNFLPTPATIETTIRSFYPTPRPSPKTPSSSQSVTHQITQHIHVSPDMTQLKPHQITINLPPSDIQRIVQNPSPLLPSQSRVIVTAKASVSDESGRPLNTTQLVTLPLPTIPASYDDYKEGDESFDPFYRDVPKIRRNRQDAMEKIRVSRGKRSLEQPYHFIYGVDSRQDGDFKMTKKSEPCQNEDNTNKERARALVDVKDFRALKDSLIKFRDILFSGELNEDSSGKDTGKIKNSTKRVETDSKTFTTTPLKQTEDNTIKKVDYLEDLNTEASKHLDLNKYTNKNEKEEETSLQDSSSNVKVNNKPFNERKHVTSTPELEFEIYTETTTARPRKNESQGNVIDIIILDSGNDFKVKAPSAKTDVPIEIIIEEETKSGTHDASKTNEKVAQREQIAGYLIKDESEKRSNSVGDGRQLTVSRETTKQKNGKDSGEQKSGPRRKSSRTRSSRRRISSKIRQQRTENFEIAEGIQPKENAERTTTTASTIATVAIPTSTTTTTTSTTTTTTTTTVAPSVGSFKTNVAEQIDSNIFGETESKTFKELDTRAIGHHNAKYSKSLQDNKSQDISKNKELERSFDHQIIKDHAKNSEIHADKTKEGKREAESIYTQSTEKEDMISTENPQSAKEARSTEVTRVSEDKTFDKGSSYKEYEFPGDDEVNASTIEEETEESSQEVSSKIYSDEVATSREANFEQEESSYREDANEKSSTDVSYEEQSLTTRYSEEINSEESNEEYQDVTESSAESTRSIQEDYSEPESTEGSTTLADYTNLEEYTDSQEDVASTEEAEDNTEGVLKFTDELPISDDKEYAETTEEISTSDESGAHDYVDDNYEPENYKGTEATTELNESEEDKIEEKNDGKKKDTTDSDHKNVEQRIDDSGEAKTQPEYTGGVTEVESLQEVASLTTTSSTTTASTTTPTTTTASTTTPSTTTASTTTPSTTTASTTTPSTTTASTTTPPTTIASTTTPSITIASTTTPSTTTLSTTTASTTIASTTTPSTTMPSTTTASTTTTVSSTTTTTATTTRRRPMTTTTRAPPPKLFKPTGNRRIYAYIPPTTTPVPVVIKPRLGLYNPKPAKPARSYNELAPKPMIRKLVLSRKPITTTVATTTIVTTTEKLNTENPEMTTEPVAMTTATAATMTTTMETTAAATTAAATTAALTTAAATTAAATTAAATTTTTEIPTTVITEAPTTVTTTTAAATTMAAMTTTTTAAPMTTTMTESGRSEENTLESKLEENEHIFLESSAKNDQADKEDQLPSPSEQNNPVNSSEIEPEITTTEIVTFTPYPLSRLSTLASSTEQTTEEETDAKPQETTESMDVLVTTVPPTTLLSESSAEHAEVTPGTEKYLEIAETTTTTSTSKVSEQETSSISSIPPIPERATSLSTVLTTVLPKAEDADPVASMEEAAILRSSGRRPTNPRKHPSFNCLEKEMYRFYGDARDCRLFHYCSPGFTSRQVLDFRFVCEEGTAFDEVTQSCRHDVRNRKCRIRW